MKWFFVAASVLLSSVASAYPVVLSLRDHTQLTGISRNELLAITPDGKGGFARVPVQVDELEDDRLLVLRKPTQTLPVREKLRGPEPIDPFQGRLSKFHRLVLDESHFGGCDEKCEKTVFAQAAQSCSRKELARENAVFKIELEVKKTVAYLIDCKKKVEEIQKSPLELNLQKHALTSENYDLIYGKESPLLLEKLTLKDAGLILSKSAFEVKINPKYFFSVTFDERNLQPEITSVYSGPVGTSAELALGLRTLGFRTSFQICCDLTAYNDAFYLPIVIDLPFAGTALKNVSGVVYGFKFAGDPRKDVESALLPFSQITGNSNGGTAAGGTPGNTLLLKSGSSLVAVGIRPKLGDAPTTALLTHDDFKTIGFKSEDTNLGVFVDLTKMKSSGMHHFDIWFYAGKNEDRALLQEYAARGIRYRLTSVERN